jgi:rhodanese-related sulfurtransferase
MPFRRVSPAEARELIDKEGYVYVDVRSIPEFQAGHPAGAVNVPLLHMGQMGMTPNREFLAVMEKAFAKDAKLVVGCKSGGRSLNACSVLQAAGFTNLVDQRAGYEGAPDPSGRIEPGWRPAGLPTSRDAPPDRTYEGIKAKDAQ